MRLLWLVPLLAISSSVADGRAIDVALTKVAGAGKVFLVEESFPCGGKCRLPALNDAAALGLARRLDQRNTKALSLRDLSLARPVERISLDRWDEVQVVGGMGGAPAIYAHLPVYSDDGRVALVSFAIAREAGEGVETGLYAMVLRLDDRGWRVVYESYERSSRSGPGSAADAPVRVGGVVRAPVLKKKIEAKYTPDARDNRIAGVVILEIVVGKDGRTRDIRVLKGLPFGLDKAAVEAVKQWEFEPGTLQGKPVDVIYTVTVNFRLE